MKTEEVGDSVFCLGDLRHILQDLRRESDGEDEEDKDLQHLLEGVPSLRDKDGSDQKHDSCRASQRWWSTVAVFMSHLGRRR